MKRADGRRIQRIFCERGGSFRGPAVATHFACALAGCGLLALLCAAGCTPQERYRVLSFFFDGVPKPGVKETGGTREVSPQFISGEVGPGAANRPKMVPHEPFRQGKCSTCHPRELSYYLPEDFDRMGLCFRCHEHEPFKQRLDAFARLHGPVAAGFCLVCHEAHESLYPPLLAAPDPDLCYRCHEKEDVLASKAHMSLADERCLPCHEPHGGDVEYFLKPEARGGSAEGRSDR